MFFLLSSFRICLPLKNDGRGELRFGMALNDFLYKRNSKECKPSPTMGKVAAEASEGVSLSRHKRMILTCIRKHAPIASQARHFPPCSGEAYIKEKRIHSFIIYKYAFSVILCRILR